MSRERMPAKMAAKVLRYGSRKAFQGSRSKVDARAARGVWGGKRDIPNNAGASQGIVCANSSCRNAKVCWKPS